MKVAGWIAIGVAALLLLAAGITLYNNTMSIDQAKVEAAVADQTNSWRLTAGGEAVIGAVFLVGGIALASRKA